MLCGSSYEVPGIAKLAETGSGTVGAGGWGRRVLSTDRVSVGKINSSEDDGGDGYTTMQM